jgi:hypothetical protein
MFDEQEPALGCGMVSNEVKRDRGEARGGAESGRVFLPGGECSVACEEHEDCAKNLKGGDQGAPKEPTPCDWAQQRPERQHRRDRRGDVIRI